MPGQGARATRAERSLNHAVVHAVSREPVRNAGTARSTARHRHRIVHRTRPVPAWRGPGVLLHRGHDRGAADDACPGRFILRIAIGEFVILGLISLITQLAASGVLALLALVAGVFVLVAVMRWARGTATHRNPVPWSRRSRLRPSWLPQRRRRFP